MSSRAINVYDFDHTIYDGDASMDFILYCLRKNPATLKHLPAQGLALALYALRQRTRKQIKEVAFAFLKDMKDVDAAVSAFWQTHECNIKPWYLRQKHSSDLIISASPEFLLKPIAKKLGIAPPIATIMNPKTGKISGNNCRGTEKVKRLKKYDPSITINDCYSDSLSDMPLLGLAQNAYIVKKHSVKALENNTSSPVAKKVLLYALFAAIATGANLGAQWIVFRFGESQMIGYLALVVGTLVGMPIKYILDKLWIFNFETENLRHDLRLFTLYLVMAISTTIVFWGSELTFGWVTHSTSGRLIGGAIGLCAGYLIKYQLDKRFVFVNQEKKI